MGLFSKNTTAYDEVSDSGGDDGRGGRFTSKLKKYMPGRLNITRIAFSTFLSFGFLLALFFRDGMFGLAKVPGMSYACSKYHDHFKASCSGKYPVYRISFSLVCFYTLFAFLASRLFCVGDKMRLAIQYRWFILKYPVFLVCLVIPWLIPDVFFQYYAWVALFASGLFLAIQIILLIDFAYSWAASWRSEKGSGTNIWDILQLVSAIVLILVAIALIVLSLVFFGAGRTCHLNRFFALFTVAISIGIIILSMARQKGLLPAAVVVAYGAFCVWSAMLSDPSTTCNSLKKITPGGEVKNSKTSEIVTAVFGILIAVFSLIRCTVSTGLSFSSFFKMSKPVEMVSTDGDDEDNNEEVNREECRELFFSHLIFLLGSFYLAMILVSWDITAKDDSSARYQTEVSKAAVWVKIISQWFTFLIFIWTLIAPKILGKYRDFDDDDDDEY